MIKLELPWPARALNPNSRPHWAAKASAVKNARSITGWAVRAQHRDKVDWQRVAVTMTFCPPDKRRRDLDNLIASSKATFDGIADALGVDDQFFVPTFGMGEPVKGGAVLVTISEAK